MSSAYLATLPGPSALPAHLVVRVMVTRADGKPLSKSDLRAAAEVYPPAPELGASLDAEITAAPVEAAPASRPAAKGKAPRKGATAKRRAA